MKKKIYTTPALSVEEYEMTIITSASPLTDVSTDTSVGIHYGGSDADYVNNGGGAMGKSRGIWDED